jgi:hypothetical protein
MTVNHKNLGTSADSADVFTLGTADSAFINLGALSTSGLLASPIRVAADGVRVANIGTLTTTGDGSPGVTVGDALGDHYDNVTVTNFGTIHTSGTLLIDDVNFAFTDGIDTYGDSNKLLNYGTIITDDGQAAGMAAVGNNNLLVNYGTIDAVGAGLVVDGFDYTESGNTLINYGTIKIHGDGAPGFLSLVSGTVMENFGSIHGDGFFSFGMYLANSDSYGENRGTILMTGEIDRGVVVEGEGQVFVNYGTIQTTGDGSIGARFSGDNPPDTDGGTITNYGKIISVAWAVHGALADDHFVNQGTLIGLADMGAGDDSYTAGKGGSLSGALTLGDGDDLIIFEKGGGSLTVTDFVAGTGTDDVIDVSAFGLGSFAQVMSHASQSGSDVILKLGPKDQIVLQNVTLGQLAADDFALASAFAQPHAQGQSELFSLV